MIGARLPEHVAPAHALETHEHVLQGVVEGVPHMQGAGDIGRGDDDAIGLGAPPLRTAATEGARLLPGGIDASLDLRWLIGLIDHCGCGFGFGWLASWLRRRRSHRLMPSAGAADDQWGAWSALEVRITVAGPDMQYARTYEDRDGGIAIATNVVLEWLRVPLSVAPRRT